MLIGSRSWAVVSWVSLMAGACGSRPREPETTTLPPRDGATASAPARVAPAIAPDREARPTGALPASTEARQVLATLRARAGMDELLPPGAATGFLDSADGLRAHFAGAAGRPGRAAVTFPKRADLPVRISDSGSGMSLEVALQGARRIDAATADGYVVYRRGHGTGATLLHRALPEGAEDFLGFEARPRAASVSYKLRLREGVAGLRLVAGTLEMLDADGTPRLRVAPPYVVGADGARADATLSVKGCAVDTNPAGPWGRPVTPPGAKTCTVRVGWEDADVAYPAVLDPKWTTTNNMALPRQDHTATFLPATGKVLVVGGRINGTILTGLATADLFDPATNTWSATGSLAGSGPGRYSHSATQLNAGSNGNTSGKVLVAGGLNGGTSVATAQVYTVTGTGAGTWNATVPSMSLARDSHTATLLGNGNVLVAGGALNGSFAIGTAAIYNPGGTSMGTWTAVATSMAARRFHTATFLTSSNSAFNNKVLMLGGNSGGTTTVTTYQLFDQATSTWSTATALPAGVVREGHTATLLANGNVLLTGGKNGTALPLQDAFVFTIPASGSTPTFPSAGTMTARRTAHTATLLQSGVLPSGQSVVVVGGSSDGTTSIATVDLWNGGTTWTASSAGLPSPLRAHTATLLGGGRVLVAGGITGTSATVGNGQVYDPSLGLACTTNAQCATGFCVAGVCCDTACTNGCEACNLTGSVGTCLPQPSGTSCRAAAGECDLAESCDGTARTCPSDAKKPNNTACSDETPANPCTLDRCDGTNAACQHPAGNAGVTCRAAAGECDVAETCTGSSASCPTDTKKGSGTACTDDGQVCTLDQCDGTNAACQHPAGNAGTVCRAASNPCDVAEVCTGSSPACPSDGFQPNGTACDDGNACTQTDTCQGGACASGNPVVCTAQDQCHVAGTCNPATGSCSPNTVAADGTVCSDGNRCSSGDACRAGTCLPGTTNACSGAGQAHYVSVIDLGSAQGGSYATGINHSGVVVGMDGNRGFRWSASGGMVYVPGPAGAITYAGAINDAGVMSAGTAPNTYLPCRYDPAVDAQPVCQPQEGRSGGINAAGTVTGWTVTGHYPDNGPITSMFRLGAGSFEILPPVPNPGNPVNAVGSWIDGDGTVVGRQNSYGAIRYMAGRGTEVLHDLLPSGSNGNFLYHASFIRSGEILGWAGWYDDGRQRGYRIKTNASGDVTAIDRLPLPAPYEHDAPNISSADASNASGKIVGTVYDPAMSAVEAAFVYTDLVGSLNLNDLIDPDSHWTLLSASSINDNDEVVGYGLHDGQTRAFKLTLPDLGPCPVDSCHVAVRDPRTGACSSTTKPDGAACDDGNACTQGDVCTAGVCAGPTAYACAAPDTCHDAGTCNTGAAQPSPPSSQDLVGWWKLDGDGKDSSGGGHDLTISGNVTAAPGRFGRGMKFDGASCMVAPAWTEARMQGATGFTMMAWVNPSDGYVCPVSSAVVMGKGFDYSAATHCWWGNDPSDPFVTGSANRLGYPGGWGFATHNRWTLMAITWDHQTLSIYVNGQFGISYDLFANPGNLPDIDPFSIGCRIQAATPQTVENGFIGTIDEAMLWRRPLAASEIAAYWAASDPCTHAVHPEGSACNDGNACTQTDTCQAGTCVGSNPVVCTADQCHTAGSCAPGTGCPAPANKSDGTACDDGNTCTQGEVCQAGSCQVAGAYPVILNLPVDAAPTLAASTYGNDINAAGQIAAISTDASGQTHAVVTPSAGPLTDIGAQIGFPSAARAINDANTVVGFFTTPTDGSHVFRYRASAVEDLGGGDGSVALGLQGAQANDINNSGQIAGVFAQEGVYGGFRYSDGVGFENVGSFGGAFSGANTIDDAGTVYGFSQLPGPPPTGLRRLGHALMFQDPTIGPIDLNTLIDPSVGWTLITALNASTDVAVGAGDLRGLVRPFRLHPSTGVVDEIPTGWEGDAWATGVNRYGDTVGTGYTDAADSHQTGFVFTEQIGLKKLNDIIDPASGWDLVAPNAISDAQEIVGWGYHNGAIRAFHLSIAPKQLACGAAANSCGGNGAGEVCLWSDGVVETSPGHFVAVFGFENAAQSSVHPTVNEVRIDGSLVANPQPAPPTDLSPGTHANAYMPAFEGGQVVSWTVNGETVTASASSRRISEVIPMLLGVADDSAGTTKAIFTYATGSSVSVSIPYGPDNSLSDQSGFIEAPAEPPPQWFMMGSHAPFVATLASDLLTWKIGNRSATATSQSARLAVTVLPDGSRVATLPGGGTVTLDSTTTLSAPLIADQVVRAPKVTGGVSLSTKGEPKVTDAGTFEYRIPIWVPEGVRGMQPSLAIVQDSVGGSGLLGKRWGVRGLSVIRRCQKTMAEDRGTLPINLSGDEFCLDGERLIRTSGTPNGKGDFRTRTNPYAKIAVTALSSTSGVLAFEVYQPDGSLYYYGRKPESRLIDTAETSSPVVAYYLDKIQDRFGNSILISYSSQTFMGPEINELVPTQIQWGATKDVVGQRSVAFNYVDGTMSGDGLHTQWLAGIGIRNGQRLESLSISGPDGDGNVELLKKYKFTYTAPSITHESLLETISECDGNDACKRPTTITWEAGSLDYDRTDLTAQGVDDVGIIGASTEDANLYRRILVADLNRDGRDDIVYRASIPASPSGTCLGYKARLAQPDGTFGPAITLPLGPYPDRHCTDPNTPWRPFTGDIVLADVTRDGYPDILSPAGRLDSEFAAGNFAAQWSYGAYVNSALAGNTVGFGDRLDFEEDQLVQSTHDYYNNFSGGSIKGWSPLVAVGDIDGDGYPEILRPNYVPIELGDDDPPSGGITALDLLTAGRGSGSVFVTKKAPPAILSATKAGVLRVVGMTPVDGNGDGVADILWDEPNDTGGIYTGLSSLATISLVSLPRTNGGPSTRWVLDLNGDGLKDVAAVYGTDTKTIVTTISTGKGFTTTRSTTLSIDTAVGEAWRSGVDNGVRVVDYNLDGRQDLVLETPWALTSLGSGPPEFTRKTQVVLLSDGAGGFTVMNQGPGGNLPIGDPADGPLSNGPLIPGARGYRTSIALDVNGDAMPDFMQFENGHLVLYTRRGNTPDVVTHIAEGTGRSMTVAYAPVTDATVYGVDSAACSPDVDHLSCLVSGVWLAKMLQVSGCDGDVLQTQTFKYFGGVFDRGGIGFLGFKERDIYGPDSVHVMKRFHNTRREATGTTAPTIPLPIPVSFAAAYTYPEAFRPYQVVTQADTAQGPNTHHETVQNLSYTFKVQDPSRVSSTFSVMPQKVTTEVYDCVGVAAGCTGDERLLNAKEETTVYDDFGNLTSRNVVNYDQSRAVVQLDSETTTYTPDTTGTWLVRMLDTKTVVSATTTPAFGTTRTTKYTYDLSRSVIGMPKGEIATVEIEPHGDTSMHLLRTYGRNDDRGRLTSMSEADYPDANECNSSCSGPCNSSCNAACAGAGAGTGSCVGGCMGSCMGTCMSTCQSKPHTTARTTGYLYEDADGVYVTTTTYPKGFTSRVWRHPGYGFVVQSNDFNGAATMLSYDTLGRKLSEVKPTGESTFTVYDDPTTLAVCGATSTIYPENSQSRAVQVRVNAFGSETRRSYAVASGMNVTQYTFYDSNGRVQGSQTWSSAVPTPLFQSSLHYDDLNRVLSECHGGVDAPWSCKTNSYDGLTTTVTNEAGRVTTHIADGQGRDSVVSAVLSSGASDATFRYGPFGLLAREQTADGQTDLAYDTLGRQIAISRTGAGRRGTTYNAFGDVIATYKLASDNSPVEKLSYGRDEFGRVTSVTGPGVNRSFSWDAPAAAPLVPAPNAKGKLVDAAENGSTQLHFDYYPSGLLKKKTWSASVWGLPELASAQYEYDPQGRPWTITYPKMSTWSNPLVLVYEYDPYLGDASRISDAGNPESPIWEVVTRGVRGEITAEKMGVPLGSAVNRNTSQYASTGLLHTGSMDSLDSSDQKTNVQFEYQYDPAGLASSFQESGDGINGTWSSTFGYDNLGRLTRWGIGECCNGFDVGVNYSYDSDGNMTAREWAGGGHGVLGYGSTATQAGGYVRTVAYEGPGGNGTDFYQADAWGRIFDTPAVALTYNAADEVTAVTERNGGRADAFYRDGLGARLVTTYGNPFDGQPWSELFTYDDLTEIRQGSLGTEERCRVRANGKLVGELVRTSDGPTRSGTFYLTDKVGSVVAEATSSASSSTTVAARARRDPFGNLVPIPETPDIPRDPTTANQDGSGRLAFADHPREDNWGLVDMQARFYSPRLGRFITPDPVIANPLDRRSFNAFAYVRNNPIAGADPQGMADDWSEEQKLSGAAAALSSMEESLQSTESEPEYRRRRPASGLQSDLGGVPSGDDGAGANSQAGTIAASMADDVAEYPVDAPRRSPSRPEAYSEYAEAPPVEIRDSYDPTGDVVKTYDERHNGTPPTVSGPFVRGTDSSTMGIGFSRTVCGIAPVSVMLLVDERGGVGVAITGGFRPYSLPAPSDDVTMCAGGSWRTQIKASAGTILDQGGFSKSAKLDTPLIGVGLSSSSLTLSGPGTSVGFSVTGSYTYVIPLLNPNPNFGRSPY